MTTHQIVLIPGDGIGPEVAAATTRVLEAAGAPVDWVEQHAGIAALESVGEVLPEQYPRRRFVERGTRPQRAVYDARWQGLHLRQRAAT